MPEEYSSLRDELLQWQEYRFLLLGFMMALVGAMLGFELREIQHYWFVISAVGLYLLAIAGFVSWYAGDGNMKIAAYLFVFHEQPSAAPESHPGWERRLRSYEALKGGEKPGTPQGGAAVGAGTTAGSRLTMNLNRWMASAYLFLGLAVLAVPWAAVEHLDASATEPSRLGSLTTLQLELLWTGFVLFWMALLALCLSDRKERYIREWERVKQGEATTTPAGNR